MSEYKQIPLQTALEVACAAQRYNKEYLKGFEEIYSIDGTIMAYKFPNKELMRQALGLIDHNANQDPIFRAPLICTNLSDRDLSNEIKKYYRRLMFNAVAGDDDFFTEVNTLLNSETIPENRLGFIACLPHVYYKELARKQFEKLVDTLDEGYVGLPGDVLEDKDCEIIEVKRSKAYDAWNVLAIIDNKMVSWMGKADLTPGPCVVVKARVKAHGRHWKNHHDETRLNYVKAAQ